MKRIKTFKLFESTSNIEVEDLEDIFINLIDRFNIDLSISESKTIRLPDDEIYTIDHIKQLNYENKYNSINITLKNKEKIIFDENFLQELDYSIKKTESLYNLKLGNIYLKYVDPIWVTSVDLIRYIIDGGSELKSPIYIEISFEIL